MIASVRTRFADLDDRDDLERISLVPVAGPANPLTLAQMQALLARRTIRVLDLVLDCGCIPDDTSAPTAARNRAIIQDAIAASGGGGVTLNVRGGISIDRSIWVDTSNVNFQGVVGLGASLGVVSWGDPALLLGINRSAAGVTLTTGHFPDAFGKLDSSAAPSAGVRYGYRTNANSHISDVFGLPSLGVGYWAIPKLTVAFCYDTPSAAAGVMFGLEINPNPSPWYVLKNESQPDLWLTFRTSDGSPYGGTNYSVGMTAPTSVGVHRIVFQLDLAAGTCIGFRDGVQVAVTGAVPTGATLLANQIAPFHVNLQGPSAISHMSDYATTPTISQTYYGLCVGNAPRYRNDGVGQPIKRIDNGATPNDDYLFMSRLGDCIFCLDMADTPAEMVEHRSVDMLGGQAVGYASSRAFVLSPDMSNPYYSLGGFTLSDMGFGTGNSGVGQAVVMANTLYPTFRRCSFGGYVGLGSWGSAANYTVIIEDCHFGATGTGFYSFAAIVRGQGLRFGRGGRATIRNYAGSMKLEDVFIEGNDFPECFVWTELGGQTHLVDFHSDFELEGTPQIASFYCNTGSNFARAAIFSLDGFIFGKHEPDSPMFLLDGRDTGSRSAQFFARRLYGMILPNVYVEEHGVEWSGVFMADEVQQGATPIVHVGGGTGGVMLNVQNHVHNSHLHITNPVAPADGDVSNGEVIMWFDQTPGAAAMRFKAKNSNGTVVNGSIPLT